MIVNKITVDCLSASRCSRSQLHLALFCSTYDLLLLCFINFVSLYKIQLHFCLFCFYIKTPGNSYNIFFFLLGLIRLLFSHTWDPNKAYPSEKSLKTQHQLAFLWLHFCHSSWTLTGFLVELITAPLYGLHFMLGFLLF